VLRASIDIGSNSCLLLILDVEKNDSFKVLESHARITSLGKDLDKNKLFLEVSMNSTFDALEEYANIVSKYAIELSEVLVTATEASRVATNADTFFKKVKEQIGLEITKISGVGEAHYTALGVSKGVKTKEQSLVIMDIGGASTELIQVNLDEFSIEKSISLPIGSVRATDWMNANSFDENVAQILSSNKISDFISEKLICVAGTMTTLSAILLGQESFIESEIHGHEFTISDLEKLLCSLKNKNAEEILQDYPVCGKRAFSIYGGGIVAKTLCQKLKTTKIEISTFGLRYGVAIEGRIDERFT